MAIVYSYPTATPEIQDLLVGTEMALQGGEDAPRTRTFTIGSIVDLAVVSFIANESTLYAPKLNPIFSGTAALPITNIVAPEPTGTPFYTNNFSSGFGDFVQSPNNDANWTIVSGEAKSGVIPDNGKSGISLTKLCPTDVTILQYTYRTSTEADYDYLFVILDGTIMKRYSGSISSTTDSIAIQTIGDHTIQFVYSKDMSDESGTDTVWLDNVSLTSGANALTVNKSAYFKDSVYLNNINSTGFISTNTLYASNYESRDANGDIKASYKHDGIRFFDFTQNDQGGYFSANSISSSLLVKVSGGTPIFEAYGTANTAMVQIPNSNANVHIGQYSNTLPAGYMLNVVGTSLFKDDVTVNASMTITPSSGNDALTINSNNGTGITCITTGGTGIFLSSTDGNSVDAYTVDGLGINAYTLNGSAIYAECGNGGEGGAIVANGKTTGAGISVTNGGLTIVGTVNPVTNFQLSLSSNSAAKPSTNTWTIASDSRVKTNINPYTKGLETILAINPITYDYNGKAGFDPTIVGNIGIIAQDVLSIIPESINTYHAKLNEEDEEKTELYNFDSHALTFILINAIKQLSAEIELLKSI